MDVKIKIYKAGGIGCLASCKFHHSCALHESAGDFRMETGFTPEFVWLSPTMGKCATGDRPSDTSVDYETVPENSNNLGSGALVYVDGKLQFERGPGCDAVKMTVSLLGCVIGEDDEEDDLMRVEVKSEHWPPEFGWTRFLCLSGPPEEIRVPFADLRSAGAEQCGSTIVVAIELRINWGEIVTMRYVCIRTVIHREPTPAGVAGGSSWDLSQVKDPRVRAVLQSVADMVRPGVPKAEVGPSPLLLEMLLAFERRFDSLIRANKSRCVFCGNGHVGGADMIDHIPHTSQCVYRGVRNAISKAEDAIAQDPGVE